MNYKNWGRRLVRKLFNCIPSTWQSNKSSWRWLRWYPSVIPEPYCFAEWNLAIKNPGYAGYQSWIDNNSVTSLHHWRLLHRKACFWRSPPRISVVTPVYNISRNVLYECILSVRAQAYPYWQFILVDDGSSNDETKHLLSSAVCKEPRIQVFSCQKTQGISTASNLGITKSSGDYVVFLDHDDRLSLDALYLIAEQIKQHREVEIIYSDRDMISPHGERYMHLFKPDWSPETLLSGNYIFHLMCYRRDLLQQLGGYRSELDGSQDYDLILRAAETQPKVIHVEKILYHWRQYKNSVSLEADAKEYAFIAGVNALNQALQRRGISGTASEIKDLWRGNYQLALQCPENRFIATIAIKPNFPEREYATKINQAVAMTGSEKPYIALISQVFSENINNALGHLAAWVQMDDVAIASGGILTEAKKIEYCGASFAKDGSLRIPYRGSQLSEAGYMAVIRLARNVSIPHPYCVLIRRQVWQQLDGLNTEYEGFYALLDFTLRALESNWRCVSVPHAQFTNQGKDVLTSFPLRDQQLFRQQWQTWLDKGDPYYNNNLHNKSQDKLFHVV